MRNATRGLLVLVGALSLVPAGEAFAQRRRGLADVSPSHDRRGFWIAPGLAAGTESFRLANVSSDYSNGLTKPTFSLGIGGTVNPQFRLGGELKAWADEYFDPDLDAEVTESLVGLMLAGQFYPARQLGLFVKGGLGISRSGVDVEFGDNVGEWGFATLLGAGYEIRLNRNLFLTPFVDYMHHRSEDRDNVDGTLHERLFSVGVNLTIQAGR